MGHSGAHGSGSDALSQIPSVLGAAARISLTHTDPYSRPHFLVLSYDLRLTQDFLGHRDPTPAKKARGTGHVENTDFLVSDRGLVPRALACVGSYLRDIRPAATMMVAGLIEEEMKIEIELTALRQS